MRFSTTVKVWILPAVLIPLVLFASGCETARVDSFDASYPDERQRAEEAKVKAAEISPEAARTKLKAEAGDAQAQFELGEMYEKGHGVRQDYSEACWWWIKAARQGLIIAQRKVGTAYASGLGVKRERAIALEWLGKAAANGDLEAEAEIARITMELTGGAAPKPVYVLRPEDHAGGLQKNAVVYLLKAEDDRREMWQNSGARQSETKEGAGNREIVTQILSDYHAKHTYSKEDLFVCVDMANDVWDQLQARGIPAKVCVGSVDKDIESLREANHAWVMAEISPGNWLALETTAGRIMYKADNARYYMHGHAFPNPKAVKEYERLSQEWNAGVAKQEKAVEEYNQAADHFNNQANTPFGAQDRTMLESLSMEANRKKAVVDERGNDLEELSARLKALLSEK